jgi:hypothetical protein
VEVLHEKKTRLQKKYSTLLDDVRKFRDEAEKRVVQQKYHKLNVEAQERSDVETLKNKVCMIKQV